MAKCINCGYLAVRDHYNEVVCEATEFTRTKGMHKSSTGTATDANVFCYQKCGSFPDTSCLAQGTTKSSFTIFGTQAVELVQLLSSEIKCDRFKIWIPGRNPKEHEEMTMVEQVQRESRKSREHDLLQREKWREEDQARQDRFEKRITDRHKSTLLVQFLLALLAAVIALIAAKLLPFRF